MITINKTHEEITRSFLKNSAHGPGMLQLAYSDFEQLSKTYLPLCSIRAEDDQTIPVLLKGIHQCLLAEVQHHPIAAILFCIEHQPTMELSANDMSTIRTFLQTLNRTHFLTQYSYSLNERLPTHHALELFIFTDRNLDH